MSNTKTNEVICLYLSVDRIENGIAVCVDDCGETHGVLLENIIGELREGSIIIPDADGMYSVDESETELRREANFDLAESLFDE